VVGKVIDEIIEAGFRKLVLVSDGSNSLILQSLIDKQKQYDDKMIIVLAHTINRGGGAANQTGYNFVKSYGDELKSKRFVGFDSDGQMDVEDMKVFMKCIKQDENLGLDLENKKPDLYL
jgi:glycosyltransferase involved in cell wall biosynthesis